MSPRTVGDLTYRDVDIGEAAQRISSALTGVRPSHDRNTLPQRLPAPTRVRRVDDLDDLGWRVSPFLGKNPNRYHSAG
jgi:hypothetical protein